LLSNNPSEQAARVAAVGPRPSPLTLPAHFAIYGHMTTTKLDLTGLKCPLPALKTRKALKALKPGDLLEVRCTDPLSVIDIPNLVRETGDEIEITERGEPQIVFLIKKANDLIEKANG
jgi:tRNA 2-thiouridine synthesizing protein A